ncbi:phosphonate ABC transporter substrate-binding protein [Methylobacterium sp. J-048]|uniref:phosphonate ABC transporter substrate-binding protein n=1 Tax=Methylobacterium sp. J-048 TaxID=2836635 RepID=UPI001FBA1002|nr:phosphonate ABC transporter substrate-binding protein [Methylobacterium sp. J-048]MCJ2060263.1 phosphonate ABC transporter substrate-binding protein [Methylobacterium sp. J-048]
MITRRILAAAAVSLAFLGLPAVAQDWKAKYPELTLAVIPYEDASGTNARFGPLAAYLTQAVGVPVKLRVVGDYAAVIEGQRAGNIHIALYGPASFGRAVMTGVKAEPIVNSKHETGLSGYYSVLYVPASSAYKTVADLKGKTLALVDPNSTSGNQAPRYFLKRAGFDVDKHFGKVIFAGSHEKAILALVQGTVDAAANHWNSQTDSVVTRMITKGMLKKPDGTPMQQSDFRVLFKSGFLPEGPYTMLASLPDDLKIRIRDAFFDLPQADKVTFDRISDGKDLDLTPVKIEDYQFIIKMLKLNEQERKRI